MPRLHTLASRILGLLCTWNLLLLGKNIIIIPSKNNTQMSNTEKSFDNFFLRNALAKLDAARVAQTQARQIGKGKSNAAQSTWAKGTGYGGDSKTDSKTTSANIKKAHTIESQNDAALAKILFEVNGLLPSATSETISRNLDLAKCPGLRWVLRNQLRNDSLIDIGSRKVLYQSIFGFLSIMSRDVMNSHLLTESLSDPNSGDDDNDEDSSDNCLALLITLKAQADIFMSLQQNSGVAIEDEDVIEALAMALHIKQTTSDVLQGVEFAKACSLKPSAKGSNSSYTSSSSSSSSSVVPSPAIAMSAAASQRRLEREYVKVLGPSRFEAVEMIEALESRTVSHCLINSQGGIGSFLAATRSNQQHSSGGVGGGGATSAATGGLSKQRMLRIAKEISSLVSNLPVEYGSCVFVRCDESRYDILKALITGPENTPYQNGCFEFDILLPVNYPESPPLVKLVTTGGGSVRFNPNLYNDGKVCLSLLGTCSATYICSV